MGLERAYTASWENAIIHAFIGDTANDVWLQAAEAFYRGEDVQAQSSRAGLTQEILHAAFTIHNPRQRWVVARTPPINPAFAIAEVVWILSGRNDSAFLNFWNSQLPRFAGKGKRYHGAYGHRLRKHFGLDQLDKAYRALRGNRDSRQVVLQFWDPAVDFPDERGKPVAPDIPCNVCALLSVRKGKLEWLQILRSNDLYLGVPYNFIQFTSLQEVLAGWLGVELGDYNHLSNSLHIYKSNCPSLDAIKPVRTEINNDSLLVPRDRSDGIFVELASKIESFAKADITAKKLICLAENLDAPRGYRNLLFVVAAEAARRRGWETIAMDLMGKCTNPALMQLWERWLERMRSRKPSNRHPKTLQREYVHVRASI